MYDHSILPKTYQITHVALEFSMQITFSVHMKILETEIPQSCFVFYVYFESFHPEL